ncbi:MAG: hypothetical protein RL094_359 [Candidatus Parcubacteria bacterium]|jgi:uncharacterized protein YdhG (YjbR/CyaY superfamily)
MPNTTKKITVKSYIAACPKEVQSNLNAMRSHIKEAAPASTERMDYFDMPGYSYSNGYDYDGMFAWFSYKKPFVRLHVRPPAIRDAAREVAPYKTTASVISFSEKEKLPVALIQKLVKRSIALMKEKKKTLTKIKK